MADCIINALRERERNGVIPIPRKGLQLGDRVRILSGALAGQHAIYQGQSSGERVFVLLSLLGVSRVELPRSEIEPVT